MIVDSVHCDRSVIGLERCCKVFHFNHPTMRRGLFTALSLSIISLLVFSYYLSSIHLQSFESVPKHSVFRCHSLPQVVQKDKYNALTNNHASSAQLRLDPRVLVFVETPYSALGRQICEILEATRIKFKVEIAGKSLPLLTNLDKGKFAAVIFENFEKYLDMNRWNRDLLDIYSKEYSVGIIGFMHPSENSLVGAQVKDWPLFIHTNLALKNYRLNPASHVLRLTKPGQVYTGVLPDEDWTVFQPNHSTYEPVAVAQAQSFQPFFTPEGVDNFLPTVLQDHGQYDGIRKIIFGGGFKFWLHKLLFLDSLSYLSHGKLSLPLQHYVLIDVDDIFVGEKGTRMKPSDVQAMLDSQKRLQKLVPGFKFNLGFSGKFYQKGTYEENRGDEFLLKHAHEFWWFCHMWGHSQPHLMSNTSSLATEMQLNKEFAKIHNIPADLGYSVAPHHSGVYPVHESLYDMWRKIWNVRVTSTEEYPHLRPARLRRGFIHRNIMVLPRQTCGLYTHTIFMDKYPGGSDKLVNSICGGELFLLFVYNPINVFMTHLSNYGNDRLALYTFESVVNFVQCWTNLQLMTLPPLQLADKYFQMFPEESDPIWMNPCNDKRHLTIWSSSKSCEQLPKFVVIGPQKTGTTALHTFLSMHPSIISSYRSPETFEEVQFFNGKNYYKGLDWYMSFFPVYNNITEKYLFEKSATYFDAEVVPMRAYALLPHAKLLTILVSPIKRAYSWYQHIKSHRDATAEKYGFYEVITAGDRAPRPLRELRNRCLNPGMYAQHLDRWLNYFSPQQLMILDGEEFIIDPVAVMNRVQKFLKIKHFLDYNEHLRYDSKKGFFCQVTPKNATKCLGRSKGRHYSSIDPKAEKFLKAFFLSHNVALSKLLARLKQPIPKWLQEDLSHG